MAFNYQSTGLVATKYNIHPRVLILIVSHIQLFFAIKSLERGGDENKG